MSRAIIFVMVLLIPACGDEPDPGVEIIFNGDMESGSGTPAAWNFFVDGLGSGFSGLWSSDQASSGIRSLSITCTSATTRICHWNQIYTNSDGSVSGKSLKFSVKVKCENLSGGGVSIAMRADAPSGNQFATTEGSQAIRGTFDWTTYTVTIPAAPDDTSRIMLFLVLLPNTTGTVYFDEASLTYQ